MRIVRVSLFAVALAAAPVLWAEDNTQTSQDSAAVGNGVEIAVAPAEEAAVDMGAAVESGKDAVESVYEPAAL